MESDWEPCSLLSQTGLRPGYLLNKYLKQSTVPAASVIAAERKKREIHQSLYVTIILLFSSENCNNRFTGALDEVTHDCIDVANAAPEWPRCQCGRKFDQPVAHSADIVTTSRKYSGLLNVVGGFKPTVQVSLLNVSVDASVSTNKHILRTCFT